MELQGERTIHAPRDLTWAALNDAETLKACIAGCESIEKTGEDAYAAVVAMKVGPVSARFRGNLKMINIDAPNAYTIVFDGQGGVAGFGKGSADVKLTPAPDPASTLLSYAAKATVGGKLAQIGSRLIDAAASKVTDDFFTAFESVLRARHAPAGVPAPVDRAAAGEDKAVEPAGTFGWGLAAIVVAVTLYFVFR